MSGWLVGYDVPGIQRYVFEPVRPLDIMGGSALLERFASEAETVAGNCQATTIYSAGGGGLFIAPDSSAADRLAQDLRQTLERLTDGGASAASASVALDGDFRAARELLRDRLAEERLARLIDEPTETLLPVGTHPSDVCRACGIEAADRDSMIGSGAGQENERIGPRCNARREQGRLRREATAIPETIRDLFPRDQEDESRGPERLPRGSVLAALYLDGDGLGRRLGELTDLEALREASQSVSEGMSAAIAEASRAAGNPPILAPVVGGDDIALFCDARHAAALLHRLWNELEQVELEGAAVRFSAAVVLSDPYLPLRLVFDEAKRALDQAKVRSRKSDDAHVELRSLVAGRLHPGRGTSLTVSPLPRDAFWADAPSLETLLRCLDDVTPAQRSEVANDLQETSHELRELLLDERAVRGRERGDVAVEQSLAEARALAEVVNGSSHDVLRAALALHSLWGDAST